MKLLQKLFYILLISFSLYATTEHYGFYYYGSKVGTIDNFNNLDKGYLQVKPENLLAKLLIKNKKQLVLYTEGSKPSIDNSFYLKDKSNFIHIVNSIKKNPNSFEKKLADNKKLVVTYDDKCYWSYIKDQKVKAEGYILFDQENNIVELKDLTNNMTIKKGY